MTIRRVRARARQRGRRHPHSPQNLASAFHFLGHFGFATATNRQHTTHIIQPELVGEQLLGSESVLNQQSQVSIWVLSSSPLDGSWLTDGCSHGSGVRVWDGFEMTWPLILELGKTWHRTTHHVPLCFPASVKCQVALLALMACLRAIYRSCLSPELGCSLHPSAERITIKACVAS